MNSQQKVLVLANDLLKGWPTTLEDEGGALHAPLASTLTHRFKSDAHCAAYYVEGVERRINMALFDSPELIPEQGVLMTLAVFDVDGPDHVCTPEWWAGELVKLDKLRAAHPGCFVYRTRGGYRIVYLLKEPITLRSAADGEAWEQRYLGWLGYLLAFGIEADKACAQWNRLFRLPHATRGGVPLDLETFGDVNNIGMWLPDGHRYQAHLALAGALVREKWEDERIISFLELVYAPLGGASSDHAMCVRTTRAAKNPTGFTRLGELLGAPDVVSRVRKLLGLDGYVDGAPLRDFGRDFEAVQRDSDEDDPLNVVYPGKKQKMSLDEATFLLSQAPEWRGVFRFNVLSRMYAAVRPPFALRMCTLGALSEGDVGKMENWFASKGYRVSGDMVKKAVATACETYPWNPFVEYLDGLPAAEGHLAWVHQTVLGVEDSFASVLFTKTLVAAVRRMRAAPGPGKQQVPVDHQSVLLLSGEQGAGKGMLVKILAGYETDLNLYGKIDIGRLKDKDTVIKVQGSVLVELEEMAASGVDSRDALKRFLSASEDHERAAFGRGAEKVGRTYAMIATTNAANLEDPTGHRRIWAIVLTPGKLIDIQALRVLRDSLWAEANALAATSYSHHLTEEERAKCADTSELLEVDDANKEAVEDAMRGLDFVTVREVYDHTTKGMKRSELLDKRTQIALTDTMKRLGASRHQHGKTKARGWRVPDKIRDLPVSDEGAAYRNSLEVAKGLLSATKN